MQIPSQETMTIEFKSDRDGLADKDLVEVAVCLANAEGGDLYIGVEDDGQITGLQEQHKDIEGLCALIANRTVPHLECRAEKHKVGDCEVAYIYVPKANQPVATTEGVAVRRRLAGNGTPECTPLYPYEMVSRATSMGQVDWSATVVPDLSTDDLSTVEIDRLRSIIEDYHGDKELLSLQQEELLGALGLASYSHGMWRPTRAGLLLLGREALLKARVPTHEIAFQVLHGSEVRVNEFYRGPLLKVFESVETRFSAYVEEEEMEVGLFRVGVPNFAPGVFREAFLNAVVHRDYTRLGATHVRLEDETLTVSNVGGLVEGVHLDNLLVTEPRPRNPCLADVIKRIGLVERTGRGVDRIFSGVLRYGRRAPDYSRTDATSVVVQIPGGKADLTFLKMVLDEEQRTGHNISLDSLIALSVLKDERRVNSQRIARAIQKKQDQARSTLEQLLEHGLVEAHGTARNRTYTLSAKVYKSLGQEVEYVRQRGFDKIQQEQMVLQFLEQKSTVTQKQVRELCQITARQASALLQSMRDKGLIVKQGSTRGPGAYYTKADLADE